MDDFLIIDKPEGMTSFQVIREVRKITGIKKIGHAGTLDPLATGVLILALGKATKKLTGLIKLDKEYTAEILLGAESDTYDRDGNIKINDQKLLSGVSKEKIESLLLSFIGEISQMPPIYSALKIKGQRACDIVRQGGTVVLKPRTVNIYDIKILDFLDKFKKEPYPELPLLKVHISCGSGTYIRSLAHDLGEKLGCGALIYNLRRTKVGEFDIDKAIILEKLKDKWGRMMDQ